MKNKRKKTDIQDMLDHVKTQNIELENFELQDADPRCGKKLALVIKSNGCLNIKTDFMEYSEMYRFLQGYLLKSEGCFEISNVPRGTLDKEPQRTLEIHGLPMVDKKSKSKEKQEIIGKIESLLESLEFYPIYPELAGGIHMDCQQLVKSDKYLTHSIYQYFPTHATIEVYRNDSSDSDADDTYDLKYSKMKLPLLKEILDNLTEYSAALLEASED